jgi:FG-GAP-like repeat
LVIPLATASGDFNHDGNPDLVVALSPSDPTQPGSLAILLAKGDGTFQAPALINLASPLVQQNVGVRRPQPWPPEI